MINVYGTNQIVRVQLCLEDGTVIHSKPYSSNLYFNVPPDIRFKIMAIDIQGNMGFSAVYLSGDTRTPEMITVALP